MLTSAELDGFLEAYPAMSAPPLDHLGVVLAGQFVFKAFPKNHLIIEDSYQIRIQVPESFPDTLPRVYSEDPKLAPEKINHHIYTDGALCLGVSLCLLFRLPSENPFGYFVDEYLVRFLYAASHKRLKGGKKFVFGEISHRTPDGCIEEIEKSMRFPSGSKLCDFSTLSREQRVRRIDDVIRLIQAQEQDANKEMCPFGCEKRLCDCQNQSVIQKNREKFRASFQKQWIKQRAFLLKQIENQQIRENQLVPGNDPVDSTKIEVPEPKPHPGD